MNHHIDTLEELATEMGVLTSYNDWTGETRRADPEILVRIFAMLGAEINLLSDAPAALRAWRVAKARQTLPPCVVSWERTAAMLPLRLPRHLAGSYGIEVLLESGAIRRYDGSLDEVPARPIDSPEGDGYVERSLTIPVGEFGYHQVIARMPGQTARCMLIAAPRAGFNRDVGKRWGVFAPLYSLHSQHSGGAGDLGDLLRIAQQTGELGASFVGTLPLLASFLDEPYEYSPYSPVSRMFWNELYLDPTTAPGFDRCAAAQTLLSASDYVAETAELRAMKRVDYRRQMAHKRRVLELLADTAWQSEELCAAMDAYQRRHPKADEYARFRAVTEARRLVWTHWPDADSRTIGDDAFDDRMRRFHLYAQFAMDAALARTADEAGVELYLDFPVGVNRCGYDTWSERDSFVLDASAGAPPDALFSEGQNWGLAPLHPQRLREAGYRYFIDSIRSHVEHAGLLRVDHVMGLHRVYWVLEGASAKDGIYVNYQAPEFYAILCLESSRNRCEVVGEDLGTVPDYVPPAMREHRLRGLYIGQFGLGADPASDESLENIPVEAVASLNTHDTPTFAGFWHGDDIADRMDLGLIDEDQAAEERKGRATMRAETITFLREQGTLDEAAADDDVFAIMNAITQYLGASQADIVLVSLEDLWLERDPQNVPGTQHHERPNWLRKMGLSTEAFTADDKVLAVLRALHQRRQTVPNVE